MMDENQGRSKRFTATSVMKLFGESEDSQLSALRDTPVEFTPIVMYSLPESSNDVDTPQEDKEIQTVSKPNRSVFDGRCFECERRKCKCIQDKDKEMDVIDLTVDLETEEPKSRSKEEKMPRAISDNATKNIEDVDMLECEQSGKVNSCAIRKHKYENLGEKKKKTPQGVSENAKKNIEDVNTLAISTKKKHKVAQGIYENTPENSNVKRTLPSSMIGLGSTINSSPNASGKDTSFNIQKTIQKRLATAHDEDNKGCDLIEITKTRGVEFPRPRWWPPEGPPETFDG